MRRKLLGAAAVIGIGLLLGGCSLLNPGPPRDSNGRVTESTAISARDLKDHDCFSFNSADGSIVEQVTVMPCALSHKYIVIGQGTLTPADVSSAGSLQNAVSAACSSIFDTFRSSVKSDTRPKQEFLVFPKDDKPNADQLYSCISTDPDQLANASPSAPTTPSPTPTP